MVTSWLTLSLVGKSAETSTYSVRWNTNSKPAVVEVANIPKPTLQQLSAANWQSVDWQKLLSVYAGQNDFMADMNVPPMLGNYRIENGLVCFQSQFPLERATTYRAVFRPSKLPGGDAHTPDIISRFQLPTIPREPFTVVTQIYPSADVLPENLLKFYVHFSAPMQGGHIYDHIHLRDRTGKAVELPFLEIDEELWNPDMTRLTLFIDPGRIKTGVQPLEEIGPALEEGKQYTLEIDADWHDATGLPLRQNFRKSFRVGPPDRDPPGLSTWKIKEPNAGTRVPLAVRFPEPMDHALALRVILVKNSSGQILEGDTVLSEQEKLWSFTPQKPWRSGDHQLEVKNTIEDLAGNNIGKAFEVDLFESVQRRFTNQVLRLSFHVP